MLLAFVCLLLALALCCSAEAEEPLFGMGRRHYLGEGRLDIKYTTPAAGADGRASELATPHIDWADPYVNGPIRAFVIPSVMEGRTLVELMQRLELQVDAVTIDPAWDVNKWTMSFGEAYGARAEQTAEGDVDFGFMYTYLEEDLSSDRTWEVMVMYGILGWGHLPESVRAKILQRVRDGMGLVIVGPFEGPGGEGLRGLSALLPATEAGAPGPVYPTYRPWRSPKGGWSAQGEHYITHDVPLETFPQDYLGHRKYDPAADSQVIAAADGDPTIAVRQVGRGRVVALGYENYGLAPFVRWEAYGAVGDAWWETWYSLLLRSIIWAAKKEPSARVEGLTLSCAEAETDRQTPISALARIAGQAEELLWQVRDDAGAVELTGKAPVTDMAATFPIPVAELNGGRHLVDVFLLSGGRHADWATAVLTARPPVSIAAVTADPSVVTEEKPVRATANLSAPLPDGASLTLELVDNYHRVIARAASPALSAGGRTATAELATDDLLTHLGWVRATLSQGGRKLDQRQVRVDFATPARRRVWDDYEVNVPFYGPQNYYPWLPLLDEQYRKAGVTWLMEPERNFRFTVLAQPGGLGVYHYDRKSFEDQMEAYWRTGDKQYLIRRPCLHRDWRETAREQITAKINPFLKYRPFHYYIYDEPSLTSYSRAFDFCFAPETIAAFREWLKKEYRTLKALNEEWGSAYRKWEEIVPPTTEEAQKQHRIPAWADFRRFMDLTYADALKYTQQVVDELDPGSRTLIGGTQVPTPFNGTDWWLFSQSIGILEPYFGIDEFRAFNPDLPIIQACGYQEAGPELEEELWRRALRGQRGATIFWNYTFHDPDLQLNSQGVAMERAFGMLRGQGVARLLLSARRDDTRVAILYSQPSLRTAWIQDGKMREGWSGHSERYQQHMASHQAWQQVLHALGLQFHYLSYEQLAKHGVDRKRFDVLVLPDAIALSDAEVKRIKTFLTAGGTVLADGEPGQFDEHSKPRAHAALTASNGVHLVGLPQTDDEAERRGYVNQIRPLLTAAGVRSPAQVSQPIAQVVRYTDGPAEYVALADAPSEAHTVTFDRSAHIYDLRARRYLGETGRLEVPAGSTRVALYSLLPGRVEAVEAKVSRPFGPGEEVDVAVLARAAASFRHVFAVHVYGPDGVLRPMYGANLDAPGGKGLHKFRLAWNDMVGEWRVVATDAATGVTGEARFVVTGE